MSKQSRYLDGVGDVYCHYSILRLSTVDKPACWSKQIACEWPLLSRLALDHIFIGLRVCLCDLRRQLHSRQHTYRTETLTTQDHRTENCILWLKKITLMLFIYFGLHTTFIKILNLKKSPRFEGLIIFLIFQVKGGRQFYLFKQGYQRQNLL